MSESFTDPFSFPDVEFETDPIPFTRGLMNGEQATVYGTMLSPTYAGGTASVEWEVLSGFHLRDLYPTSRMPFVQHVAARDSYPTFIGRHGTADDRVPIAIHPFYSASYQRDRVYPTLGFQQSEFVDDFTVSKIEASPYVPDSAGFDRILSLLKASDDALFVHYLTMQNHAPYEGSYVSPIGTTGTHPDEILAELGQYATGLSHSDSALESFLQEVRDLGEPTVVLFFGDHHPGIISPEALDSVSETLRLETPFFVWSTERLRQVDIPPLVSPTHLISILHDAAGLPLSPMDALLRELRQSEPVRHPWLTNTAISETTEPGDRGVAEPLRDLRLFQFDLVAGNGYVSERLHSPALADQSG